MEYCNIDSFSEKQRKRRHNNNNYQFDNYGNIIPDSIEDLIDDKFTQRNEYLKNSNKEMKSFYNQSCNSNKKKLMEIDSNKIQLQYKDEQKSKLSSNADQFLDSIVQEENSENNINISCESKNSNNFLVHLEQNGVNKIISFVVNVKESDDMKDLKDIQKENNNNLNENDIEKRKSDFTKETKDATNNDNYTISQIMNGKEKNMDFSDLNHNLKNYNSNNPLIVKNKLYNNKLSKNFDTIKSTAENKLLLSLNKNNCSKNENYEDINNKINEKLNNNDKNLILSNDYKNKAFNFKKFRISQSLKKNINDPNKTNKIFSNNSQIFDNTNENIIKNKPCSSTICFISKSYVNKKIIKTFSVEKEKKQLSNKISISKIYDINFKADITNNKKYLNSVKNKLYFVSKEYVKENNKFSLYNKNNFEYSNQKSNTRNNYKKIYKNNYNDYNDYNDYNNNNKNNYNTFQDANIFKSKNNYDFYQENENLRNRYNYQQSKKNNDNRNIKYFRYPFGNEFPAHIQIQIKNPVKEPIIYEVEKKESIDQEKKKENQNEEDSNRKSNSCKIIKTKKIKDKNDKDLNKLLNNPKKQKKKILKPIGKKRKNKNHVNSCDYKCFKNEKIIQAMKNKNNFASNKTKKMSVNSRAKSQINSKGDLKKTNSEIRKQKRKTINFKRIKIKSKEEGDDSKGNIKIEIMSSPTKKNEIYNND